MENRSIESGVQLFSRITSEHFQVLQGIDPELFSDGGPFGDQVIELFYDENSPYTDFLIEFVAKAILPTALHPTFKQSQVILLHTDFQMNLFKIIKVLERQLESHCASTGDRKSIIEQALRNLVMLDCYTADQLEITFHNLEHIINKCQKPGLIILDNSLSQYWVKKFDNFKLSFDEHCIKTIELLYGKVQGLNVVMMYGRENTRDSARRSSIVTHVIHITAKGVAYVESFEKNTS